MKPRSNILFSSCVLLAFVACGPERIYPVEANGEQAHIVFYSGEDARIRGLEIDGEHQDLFATGFAVKPGAHALELDFFGRDRVCPSPGKNIACHLRRYSGSCSGRFIAEAGIRYTALLDLASTGPVVRIRPEEEGSRASDTAVRCTMTELERQYLDTDS